MWSGKSPGKEKGNVAQPPVAGRTLRNRQRLHHLGKPNRIELAKAPLLIPLPGSNPHGPAGNSRERSQKFAQEVAASAIAREVLERRHVENRQPLARSGPSSTYEVSLRSLVKRLTRMPKARKGGHLRVDPADRVLEYCIEEGRIS